VSRMATLDSRRVLTLLLCAVICCGMLRAQDAEAPDAGQQATELVRLLGSSSWAERERASRDLVGLGVAARPALRESLGSDDAEVRLRASRALVEIGEDFQFAVECVRGSDENLIAHGRRAISELLGLTEPGAIYAIPNAELQQRGSNIRQNLTMNHPPELALLRMQSVTGMSIVVAPCAREHWARILEQPQLSGSFTGDLSQLRWVRDVIQRLLNSLLGNPQEAARQVQLNVIRAGREHFFYVTSGNPPADIARDCTNRLISEFLSDDPSSLRATALLAEAARASAKAMERVEEQVGQPELPGPMWWLALALEQPAMTGEIEPEQAARLLQSRDWRGLRLVSRYLERQESAQVTRLLSPVIATGGDALQVSLALWFARGHELDEPARARAAKLLSSRQELLAAAAVRWFAGAPELTDAELSEFWRVGEFQRLDTEFFRAAVEVAAREDLFERLEDRAREALGGMFETQMALASIVLRGRATKEDLARAVARLQAARGNERLVRHLRSLFTGVTELEAESEATLLTEAQSGVANVRAAYRRVLAELDPAYRRTLLRKAVSELDAKLAEETEAALQPQVIRVELLGVLAGAGDAAALQRLYETIADESLDLARAAGTALVDAVAGDQFFDEIARRQTDQQAVHMQEVVLAAMAERCRRAADEDDPRTFRRAFSILLTIQVPTMWQLRHQLTQLQGQMLQRIAMRTSTDMPASVELRRLEVDVP